MSCGANEIVYSVFGQLSWTKNPLLIHFDILNNWLNMYANMNISIAIYSKADHRQIGM